MVGKHSGSAIIAVTTLRHVASLQSPSHDTESTPGATRHVRHIMLLSFSFGWGSWCCQHARRAHRVGHLSSKSVSESVVSSISTSSRSDASTTSQTACVFLVRPSVYGLTSFLFMMRIVLSPACENLRNPQPYGEQATGPLKRNGISILTLDPGLFIQYELMTSLKQTAGGNQRFAHICDPPRWCSCCSQRFENVAAHGA